MWLEDVFLMNKFQIFCSLVMLQHMVDILEDTKQQKFFIHVIIGPLFLEILMSLLNAMAGAKEQETSLKSIKCH